MITKKEIMDAYVFLRTKNNSIPDEVLDFIKDTALEKLKNQTTGESNNDVLLRLRGF